ncbi:MAG: DUF2147 domain-containing protein [Asticcacaulis sp.]|nr:DUF2147 domain-containing protein [Asticcacaulis sp.]
MRLSISLLLAFSLAIPGKVLAADLSGNWQRANGQAQIAFAPCAGGQSEGVCGTIAWLNPAVKTKAHIGDKVFYDLVSDGANSWKGKAYSPKEGKTYAATLTLQGTTLYSRECLFGDRICRSETWTRVR